MLNSSTKRSLSSSHCFMTSIPAAIAAHMDLEEAQEEVPAIPDRQGIQAAADTLARQGRKRPHARSWHAPNRGLKRKRQCES